MRAVVAWIERLLVAGARPDDSYEERLRKASLVLGAGLITILACAWTGTYFALGLPRAAAIPLTYQLATVVTLVLFLRTGRSRVLYITQLVLMLVLPFLLQWSLGGFVESSAVSLWAFVAPLCAMMFLGARAAIPWFAAFILLLVVSAVIDGSLTREAGAIPGDVALAFFVLNVFGVSTTTFVLLQHFLRDAGARAVGAPAPQHPPRAGGRAPQGRGGDDRGPCRRGDRPVRRPGRLHRDRRADGCARGRRAPQRDLLGLRRSRRSRRAREDQDAGGRLHGRRRDPDRARRPRRCRGGSRARDEGCLGSLPRAGFARVGLRIGLDSGPVVAGVIGRRKFSYDLWGDTVNTASRMQSHAEPGEILATEETYRRLVGSFELEARDLLEVKGKGSMRTYVLKGRSAPAPATVAVEEQPVPRVSGRQVARPACR